MDHYTINAEMVIGLKYYPNQYEEIYTHPYGWFKQPKPVKRYGLSILGMYLPSDIGRRVWVLKDGTERIESKHDAQLRLNMTEEEMHMEGLRQIDIARKKYMDEKNQNGRAIIPLNTPKELFIGGFML